MSIWFPGLPAGLDALRVDGARHFLSASTSLRRIGWGEGGYRAKFVGQIAQEIKKTREAISSSGSVKVEGLESPVMVRQADDRNVELFLNYSLSITAEK